MKRFLPVLLGFAATFPQAPAASPVGSPPSHAPQATVVYGYVLNPAGQTKPAFYSFPLTAPAQAEAVYVPTNVNNGEGGGAMTPKGYLVMAKPSAFTSYLYGYYYNMNPWEYSTSISGKDSGTNSSEPFFSNDVTWDPVTKMLYGCYKKPGSSYSEIAKMDIMSSSQFRRTPVGGSYSGSRLLNGIAADSGGTLYGIGANGTLYTISKTSGTATEVGPTGLTDVTSATFNLRTDILYAATWSSSGGAALYTVDTETGKATKLYDLPNNEHIEALAFELPRAAEKAPDAPTNFRLDFPEGSMTGKFIFDTPSKLYDETPATGEVDYIVYIDNTDTKVSGTTEYGKTGVAVDYSFTQSGKHDFWVVLKNGAGESDRAMISQQWIGCGVPDTPSGIRASADGTKVTISWNAVTQGNYDTRTYNAFFNPEEVTYTVICTSDDDRVVVAGTRELSCVDELGEIRDMVKKSYRVKACFRTNTSQPSSFANVTIGSSFGLPFSEDFTTGTGFSDFWTSRNVSFYHNSTGYIYCSTYSSSTYDGWVFTPKLRLKAGKEYSFRMQYWCRNGNGATLEVKAGMEQDKDAMTVPLVDMFTVTGYQGDDKYAEAVFTVPEDGEYAIGINLRADKISEYVQLDNIEVYLPTAAAPKAPEFTAECGADGELKSHISVTAPVLGADDGKIAELTKLTVKRGDTVVFEQENPEPGKTYATEETFEQAATVAYTATATNAFGESLPSSARIFVGFNRPAAPGGLTVEENPTGTLTLSWQAPDLDPEGNPLKDTRLTYTVVNAETGAVLQNAIEDTSYRHRVSAVDAEGRYVSYKVFATNNAGDGDEAASGILFAGNAATGVWVDSFAAGRAARSWARQAQGAAWQLSDDTADIAAYDDDHGMLLYSGEADDKAVYTTVPQAIPAGGARYLSLYYNTLTAARRARMTVLVTDTSDGSELAAKEITPVALPNNMWIRASVDLSAYAGKTVTVGLCAEGEGSFAVDMVRMSDVAVSDIVLLSVAYPENVASGTDVVVRAAIANFGDSEPAEWAVSLEKDGDAVVKHDGNGVGLPAGKAVEIELPAFRFTPLDAQTHHFRVRAEAAGDDDPDNGISDITITHLLNNELGTVSDLTACKEKETGFAILSWEAPAGAQVPEGYNVWRGKELVTSTPVTGTTYIDKDVEEAMGTVYAVTAVYAGDLQSLPVYATVDSEMSGISPVCSGWAGDAEYYDLRGIRIYNPAPGQTVIRRKGDRIDKIKF